MAPDEASARRIAEAIIRNVPASRTAKLAAERGQPYDLIVERDEKEPRLWLAFQSPQKPPDDPNDNIIVVQFAGHGLGMRIDSCTGEVSDMYFQR